MGWKIVFNYYDGGQLKISQGGKRTLTKQIAEKYQKEYARRSSNDGGMVYHTPFRTCTPVPLAEYIKTVD